mmetsp:Transcript_2635/g.8189  ORF Transcript_2635/g.8189 Transcript_2635/m.8189 type:complete len:288 (-) Transcript_2635:16-879(-)
MSAKVMSCTSRSTGTTRPVLVATAMEMSTKSWCSMWSSFHDALMMGTSCSAVAHALAKGDMKPSLTPWRFANSSLCFSRRLMRLVMSISLKVVSIAAVFWLAFRRSAMRRRMADRRSWRTRVSWPATTILRSDEAAARAGAGVGAAALGASFFASAFGASAFGASALAASALGADSFLPPAGASPSLIDAIWAPTLTTSPAVGTEVRVPALGAFTSTLAFSDSMTQMTSSSSTKAPFSLSTSATVPSEMDSLMLGTTTLTQWRSCVAAKAASGAETRRSMTRRLSNQ